jgi:hypothetical protein
VDRFHPIQQKILTGRINKLVVPNLRALCESNYNEIDARINDHVLSVQVSFSSFNQVRNLLLSNLFRNIPSILHSSPVDRIRGILEKRPALVVSAGPSLDHAIEAIKNHGRDLAVISVDAALKPLVNNGIIPDMVVNCDPLPINRNKVSGLPGEVLGSSILVYQADGSPHVVESFTGKKFFSLPPNTLGHWLVNVGRRVPCFPAFHGTSHMALLLAGLMGADPIVLVGLDLSFPEDRHHAEGCGHPRNIDCSQGDWPLVPRTGGGMVRSIPIFLTMIRMIEKEIMQTPSRCINVSRHGALIRGTESMTMEEVLKAVRSRANHPAPIGRHLEQVCDSDPNPLKNAVTEALKWMISEAETTRGLSEQAVKLIETQSADKNPLFRNDLRNLYCAASGGGRFLGVISDFLPRYMVSAARHTAPAMTELAGPPFCGIDDETLSIFFEEIHSLLPELLLHSREALSAIQGANRPGAE